MKMLVIGMDGAQFSTFQRGWTPFLQSLIRNQGVTLDLKEDLISRGWAEVMTGKHALETGAMYERPLMGGTHRWTDKLSLADIQKMCPSVKPIWKALNERGYRVGIMNVPTTFPAPEVDGFFVSGGGGGGDISQRLKPEQCHPSKLADLLNGQDYIVDERLPSLLAEKRLFSPASFFARLDQKNTRRTDAFIDLAQKESIDFGFIVYKSSVNTAETLVLPEIERQTQGLPVNENFIEQTRLFYTHFDSHIRRLAEAFPDAEILLVSDHAMAPRKWSVNFNAFLLEQGFQRKSDSRRGLFDVVRSARHLIPHSIRQHLKSSAAIKSAYESMVTFDPRRSQAFNITFTNAIHGFYVNDKSRFGGPVPSDQIEDIRTRLIDAFNAHPVAQQHGFKAYAKAASGSLPSEQFPDVVVDMPDGYAPSNGWSGFVTEYVAGQQPIDLREMLKDKRISAKAHRPLAVLAKGEWKVAPDPERADLTLIYDQILATFPANEAACSTALESK